MHHPDHNASPFNALPPVAVFAALAMLGVEIAIWAGGQGLVGGPAAVGWRIEALERFAFSGPLFEWMLGDMSRLSAGGLLRLVSYPFVHGSFTHMLFAVVITLALGKFVGEVFSPLALISVWLASSVAGALGYATLTSSPQLLFGGMAPAYGLIGAFTFILWRRARARREPVWTAFRMIGLLAVLQAAFALIQGGVGPQIVAEIAAFTGGFAISFLVSPGGWTGVVAALRQR
jgi:membrane associated rhomboid family serine protease